MPIIEDFQMLVSSPMLVWIIECNPFLEVEINTKVIKLQSPPIERKPTLVGMQNDGVVAVDKIPSTPKPTNLSSTVGRPMHVAHLKA